MTEARYRVALPRSLEDIAPYFPGETSQRRDRRLRQFTAVANCRPSWEKLIRARRCTRAPARMHIRRGA